MSWNHHHAIDPMYYFLLIVYLTAVLLLSSMVVYLYATDRGTLHTPIALPSAPLLSLFQETNYFTPQGEFRVDAGGSPTLLNCLMYKLCYYRFGDIQVMTMHIVMYCGVTTVVRYKWLQAATL